MLKSELIDTLLNEENKIRELKTVEECETYCDVLVEELQGLKKKKKELKYDVSQEMDELMYKLGVLEEVKLNLQTRDVLLNGKYMF